MSTPLLGDWTLHHRNYIRPHFLTKKGKLNEQKYVYKKTQNSKTPTLISQPIRSAHPFHGKNTTSMRPSATIGTFFHTIPFHIRYQFMHFQIKLTLLPSLALSSPQLISLHHKWTNTSLNPTWSFSAASDRQQWVRTEGGETQCVFLNAFYKTQIKIGNIKWRKNRSHNVSYVMWQFDTIQPAK